MWDERKVLAALFAAGMLLRVGAVLYFGDFTNPATAEYGYTALNLAAGRGFFGGGWLGPEAPTALNAPGYIVMLAAALRYLGPQAYLALELVQAVLSGLLPLLVYRLASTMFDRRVAFWSFVVAVAYPPFIYFPKQISPAIVTTLAAGLAVLAIVELAKHRSLLGAALCGAIVGITALIEPIALITAVGIGVLRRRTLDARQVIIVALVALLALLPWGVRNYLVFQTVVPIKTSFGLNLWLGNNPLATGYLTTADGRPMSTVVEPELARALAGMNEAERYATMGRQAVDWIVHNPLRFVDLTLRRLYYFWWTSPTVDVSPDQAYEPIYLYRLQVLLHAPFLLFGALGAWWAYRLRRGSFWPLIWWLASFTAVYAVSIATNRRFRLPAETALIVLAVYGASLMAKRLRGWREEGRREFLVVALSFLAIIAAIFWRVVLLQEVLTPADLVYFHDPVWRAVAPLGFQSPSNPLLSDLVFQFYPWLVFSSQNICEGIIPLWNPFILAGTPFVANQQSAVFYPLNLLLCFLPMPVGIGYLAIIRLLIAALSSYYYVRILGVSKTGAFVGASAFAFGGFSIVWLGYSISNVAVLLPLALLLAERTLRYSGPLHSASLALVIGAGFLGGHPETSFYFGLIWAAYVSFRLVIMLRDGVRRWRVAQLGLIAVACFVVGFLIAAAQTLPFVAALPETAIFAGRQSHSAGLSFFSPEFWRAAVTGITIAFPNALGNPSVPYMAWVNPFSNFNEQAAYIGTVPLALAVVGATLWRRNPFVAFWLAAAVVSVGVAYHLPGFEVVNHLPLFGAVANGRLRLALTFAAAVLSAFGADLLIKSLDDALFVQKLRRWLGRIALLALIVVTAVFAALTFFRDLLLGYGARYVVANVYGRPGFPDSLDYYLGRLPTMYDALAQFYNPLSLRVSLPIVFAAGLWLALGIFGRRQAGRIRLKIAIVLLTVVEVAVLAYGYNPSLPARQVYPETEALAFLESRAGTARIAGIGFALNPNASMLRGLRDIRGYENTVGWRFQRLYDSFTANPLAAPHNLMARPSPDLLRLLGVKYIVAEAGAVDPQLGFSRVFASEGIEIHENPNALPRAFVVGQGRPLSDDAALQTLHSPSFDPCQEVLLESAAPAYSASAASGEASVRDRSVNEVEVLVDLDAPAWLVLNDTYDSGWKAYVDGQEASIYRANYVVRAVRVAAGRHQVLFRYAPPSFSIGARVSIAALLLTGLTSLLARRFPTT